MEEMIGYIIGIGGLVISGITLITAYLRSTKQDAAESQMMADRLDNINNGVNTINEKVDKLDNKLDDHSMRITKVETEIDNIYRRIDRVEKRCENHLGIAQHE